MEVLEVKNVKCGGCVEAIKNGLSELEGVDVKISISQQLSWNLKVMAVLH